MSLHPPRPWSPLPPFANLLSPVFSASAAAHVYECAPFSFHSLPHWPTHAATLAAPDFSCSFQSFPLHDPPHAALSQNSLTASRALLLRLTRTIFPPLIPISHVASFHNSSNPLPKTTEPAQYATHVKCAQPTCTSCHANIPQTDPQFLHHCAAYFCSNSNNPTNTPCMPPFACISPSPSPLNPEVPTNPCFLCSSPLTVPPERRRLVLFPGGALAGASLVVQVPLAAQTTVLLASTGQTTQLTVLVHGVADPVGTSVLNRECRYEGSGRGQKQ